MGTLNRLVAVSAIAASTVGVAPALAASLQPSITPPTVRFGDRLMLRVEVQLDDRVVRPASFHLTSGIAPLTQLGKSTIAQRSDGHTATISIAIPATCLVAACVTRSPVTQVQLPALTARVTTVGGELQTLTGRWEALAVARRVSARDLAKAKPPFRTDTSIASPTFRIAPHTLALVLDVLAVLLSAGAAWLLARQAVLSHRRRHPVPVPDALTVALQRVRESQKREAPDRRRALGLLARILERRGLPLGEASSDLAWSRPEPTPERVGSLASRVDDDAPA